MSVDFLLGIFTGASLASAGWALFDVLLDRHNDRRRASGEPQ